MWFSIQKKNYLDWTPWLWTPPNVSFNVLGKCWFPFRHRGTPIFIIYFERWDFPQKPSKHWEFPHDFRWKSPNLHQAFPWLRRLSLPRIRGMISWNHSGSPATQRPSTHCISRRHVSSGLRLLFWTPRHNDTSRSKKKSPWEVNCF